MQHFPVWSFAAALLVLTAFSTSHATDGEVISVQGDAVRVLVRSGAPPAVGDTVTVMNVPDANGNAMPVGEWRVTEVSGNEVEAVLIRRMAGQPSEAMEAIFRSSGASGVGGGADVEVPGSASSGVPGKVTEVRGDTITVRLDREATPVVGDRIDVSFSSGEDTIPVGTWRVTKLRGDGRVEAEKVEAEAPPTPQMDALVYATGTRAVPPTSDTPAQRTPADELFEEAVSIQPKDGARAVALFEEAARVGHAGAAERAAIAYESGQGVPRDDARAAALFRQAAEAGRPVAQNYYGSFLATGRGVAKDDPQAVMWYRRAAAQGDSWAQANLCNRYFNGEGVEKNYDEALRLCRLAEAQNNPAALNDLGWIYQNGLGVEKDIKVAVDYYRRSAELGYANGQNNLAYMYEKGWGVDRDLQQALYWYRESASKGWAWAEWNLGRLYSEGIGVSPDQAKAIEHWQRAARAGHDASREKLQQLGVTW